MNGRLTPLLWVGALLCALTGGLLLWRAQPDPLAFDDAGGAVSVHAMDAAIFNYSEGWQVSATGADPGKPADPWQMPAGVVTFTVTGADLFVRLAVGDYWGYLYATVDGRPANALPNLRGNTNRLDQAAGYRTLYAPEAETPTGPNGVWTPLYTGLSPTAPHTVRIEVWRGWGQTPLRGVATTQLPPDQLPGWTGLAYLVAAGWIAAAAWLWQVRHRLQQSPTSELIDHESTDPASIAQPRAGPQATTPGAWRLILLAGVAVGVIGLGVYWQLWTITLSGLALLGAASLMRPVLWLAALFFALPFYFGYPLPLLPARSFSLVDIGSLGALGLWAVAWLRAGKFGSAIDLRLFGLRWRRVHSLPRDTDNIFLAPHFLILAAIASWALVATGAATHLAVAGREWRVVFLTGALMAGVLPALIRDKGHEAGQPRTVLNDDLTLLVTAWLAGGAVAAGVALGQYAAGANLITAEGVWRVRAFYGSPNNLALYLERGLAVVLALALFARAWPSRLLWGGLAATLAAALLLTFSKGALLLGLPAMLVVTWLGGWIVLGQQQRSRRLLWVVATVGVAAALAMTPFLATERFQRLLDFSQGTGFVRLNLWRSSWQMALDHPLVGVGPDNFLYAYRSFYLLPAAWQEPNLNHPHNWPLDWWTRLGLPGLALAIFWFGWLVRRLWLGVRGGAQPALSVGLLAAVAAALAHGLIDASFALPDLMLVWVLIGFLALRLGDDSRNAEEY